MSRRKLIREAIVNRLKGETNALERVYSNPTTPTWEENTPVINVFVRSENLSVHNETLQEFRRELEIAIEVIAKGSEDPDTTYKNLDDVLDDTAEQVEKAMFRDETFGTYQNPSPEKGGIGNACTLVDRLTLSNIEFQHEGAGESSIGSARLIFMAVYIEARPHNRDDQNLGQADLESINAEWDVQGVPDAPDDVIEAEDSIDLTSP